MRLGEGSSWAMISIVLTFGAPVTDAGGKRARNVSLRLAVALALMVEVICHTVGYFSTVNKRGTLTLPGSATRPKSFRTISTIITFSARSFSEAVSYTHLTLPTK